MNASRFVDALAAPLDVARRGALSAVTRSRGLTLAVGRRDTRVPLLAAAQIALLLALTAARPVWLFVVGPVLLGVPHLASDVRYLVLRQRVARPVVVLGCVATAVILGLHVLPLAHVRLPGATGLEVATGGAWIALALAAGARERRSARPLLAVPLLVAVALYASAHGGLARTVLAQLHNVVGIGAWLFLFRRNRRAALLPLAALAAATLLLATGATLPWAMRTGGLEGLGVDLWRVGATLAPGTRPETGAALALVFVFLQAVHYAVWLVWIPQDELPGEGTLTFRMSGRGLVRDFGVVGLGLVAACGVALAGAAAFDAR
ncbi:MAG TPA: hypothetical protein VHS09_09455, partial [Polyangiaceae bacterium]|nr:hypothetical protein [Polyangiaceae bacterium]